MSDFTDDMLEGEYCCHCGTYLGEACGYPRFCEACHNPVDVLKDSDEFISELAELVADSIERDDYEAQHNKKVEGDGSCID